MDIGTAILMICFAALVAAFFLLVIRVFFSEVMNAEIPLGVASRGKLQVMHCSMVGIEVTGRILERLGLCNQVHFTRWWTGCMLGRKRPSPADLRIKDSTFAGVPVRIYEPTAVSEHKRRGLVYFHGGGWVLGSIDMYDEVCRHIASKSDTVVVSVGYRLAPEHRFPAALDDCELATRHFLSVAADFNVDPLRVALGGDSAGGNLAAALSQRLATNPDGHLPSPCGLVLIYPALQMADFNLPSYQQNHAVPVLLRARTAFYYLQYLNGDMSVCQDVLEGRHVPAELKLHYSKWLDPSNLPPEFRGGTQKQVVTAHDGEVYHIVKGGLEPGISPLLAEDKVLRLTPPTFILTCQYDVLRDDGILYRKRLQDLGIKVTWYNVPDGFHGIMNFFRKGWMSIPAGVKAMEQIVSYIKTL
ncbi:arylacetamide deacetylase-like 4 [Tachysurus fulvidraco]|uniref:arylacetamide deacetylase-like 4 n=1 Tax=Tachysurus fulvidraco TaxID=1234273 RepID=UPI001FEFB8B2|nr:arylacetamide deacetylase-like 4 [Tachysurus fulvidraco]